ncbi:xanthine dehydrogenase family protein molybdopterin-binding subunit [Erythrobacter litoralis]|uniref:Aldehyde oxidase and xanthine dehydrogenase, molybdopterin binding n=1 Tax=Erythrobacter litoralis (strain HTCC2594) TaxID=314225 RepID=Q2N7K4_ERYLH|nr:molybdopterin cofactor-binding domain-containing protein [Erythrobacter litoralis]ABC64337.1 Aldehyde oxidase and xanthine dehydrogenase, molybdopterin binding [Erythrobacter litoralis HTCC2594]
MSEQADTKPARSRTAKWTRRGVMGAGVLAGGALLIGVAVRPGNPVGRLKPLVAEGDEELVNSWVKIDTDNTVTAIVPHCEMGQGAHSVLGQMLADELDADWNLVKVMQAPADGNYVVTDTARMFVAPFTMNAADWIEPTYDGLFTQIARLADAMITGGSSSIRTTGQHQMRIAGAAARQMLVGAAAEEWDVPAGEIETRNSMLIHAASGKEAPYAQFAAAAAEQPMPQTPRLKDIGEYRLMGKSKARTDIPAKVNGTATFGIDAEIPADNLSYAAVMRPPVPGTEVASMDAEAAKSMGGVLQILNMGDHVAVVADSYWQAEQALGAIDVTWTQSESKIATMDDQFAAFAAALDAAGDDGGSEAASKGDARDAFANAATIIEAEYRVPYLAHAPMEPINCTAWVHDGKCEIWTSTQVPLMARKEAANAIGLDADDITIHHPMLGGGFGRRLVSEYVGMAARVAKATGYPVKMIWSREEDTQKSMYRPADMIRFKGGLDADGKLVSYNSVFTQRHDPAEACVPAGYGIPNLSVRVAEAPLHLPFQAWRSVDHSQHGFFTESFIDEAAHAAGADPLDYRIAMLADAPRHRAVLEKLQQVSGWDEPAGDGKGRGVAMVESFGTIVAEAVEVDMSGGKPRATKVYAVADPGYAMNPDGFRNQIEGGIVFGLTAALYGELELEGGRVKQSNFHDYKMLRMNECPEIEVAIINSGPVPIGGAGEPGTPPIAPAFTNAIFAATGRRIRDLPVARQFA